MLSQSFDFRPYSLEDGLSQSEINCIFEDSRGYLWVGTAGGGVCRFDGKEFKSYEEAQGLNGTIVTAIAEDAQGNMWFGTTWGGVNKFNGKSFTKLSETDGLLSNGITALIFDNNGDLLIGTSSGLSIYNGSKFINIETDEKTNEQYNITCFAKGVDNKIWIGTTHGVHEYLNGKIVGHGEIDKNLNGHITSIVVKSDEEITVVEKPCIWVNHNYKSNKTEIIHAPFSTNTVINKILIDNYKNTWIATANNGVYLKKKDESEFVNYNKQNGLGNSNISVVYCDANNVMWFGTRGSGLYRLSTERFEYFDRVEGLNDEAIFSVHVDEKKNIYTGVTGKGVYKFDGKNSTLIIPVSETDRVFTITENKKGELLVGTNKGLLAYSNGKIITKKLLDTLKSDAQVRTILVDSKGNTWVSVNGYGVIKLVNETPTFYGPHNGLLSTNIYQIKEDKKGNIVFGSNSGIFIYDGNNFKQFATGHGLCNSYAGNIVIDKYNNIWVGTDNCVAVFNGTKFKSFGVNEGLTSATVYLMNIDKAGNIWVGTNKGVDKISADNSGYIQNIKNYNRFEGFKGIECNSRATCIDNDGNIYFGTIKGLIKYLPKYDFENKTEPKIHVTGIRVLFDELNWEKFGDSLSFWFHLPIEHEFSYAQNHLTFDFTGINKSNPEKLRYKFKLDGFDDDWNKPTDHNFATYSNLSPGTYTFLVQACNEDGIWTKTPAQIKFTILAPLWRTWGFMVFCAGLLAACIYYYNKIRKLQIQKRNLVLEKLVRERTSELQKQKEEKDVLLKEVHHRVKNNLQIVNSLINIQSANITDKDALNVFEESKNKIKSIALIHERLYKSETMSHIDIGEYLKELLNSLLETYNINKEIKLVTDIKIKSLNLNTIIPLGLLINELISNSIKYAFKNKNDGEIYIQIRESADNSYEMKIGDNGDGFDFDPFAGETTTLGLELVKILIEQLDGTVKKLQTNGTYYQLTFKSAKS